MHGVDINSFVKFVSGRPPDKITTLACQAKQHAIHLHKITSGSVPCVENKCGRGDLQFTYCFCFVDKVDEEEIEGFKMEINFMKTLGRHENVVTILGCCTLYPPLCLIVEYVPYGDLLQYLRNLRNTVRPRNIFHQENSQSISQPTISQSILTLFRGLSTAEGDRQPEGNPDIAWPCNPLKYF